MSSAAWPNDYDDELRVRLVGRFGQSDRLLAVRFPFVKLAELGKAPGHPRQ